MAYVFTTFEQLPAELKAAVDAGDVSAIEDKVSISDKASPTGKGLERSYIRLGANTAKGMAVLNGGKINPASPKPEQGDDTRTDEQKANGACDYHNYGYDLDARAKIRAGMMTELEGPEKAINKAVKALVDAGMPEDTARNIIVEQRRKAGLAV
jgi:hypothetical protein